MTIASALENLNTDIINARTAITTKGGTVTVNGGSSQLATDIATIPTGGASSKYGATVDSFLGDVDANGVLQLPSTPTNLVFTGVEKFSDYALIHRFYKNPSIISVDFSDLTAIQGGSALEYTFANCPNLTSVDLSNLTTVNGGMSYAFYYAGLIGNLDLSSLTTVSGSMSSAFYATKITSVDLSSLTTVSGSMSSIFFDCPNLTSVDLSNLTTVNGRGSMSSAFYDTEIINLDLSSLTTVSGNSAFEYICQNCSNLTSVDLSSLTTVEGQYTFRGAFKNCSNLENIDLSSLTRIGRINQSTYNQDHGILDDCFLDCSKLKSVDLSNLTTIKGGMQSAFQVTSGTSNLITSFSFLNLTTIDFYNALRYCFRNRNGLQTLSFPSLTPTSFGSYTNQFNNMLSGVTGCTVHFPSNLQSVIGSWSDVTAGFGGTNTTVLFDLTATT